MDDIGNGNLANLCDIKAMVQGCSRIYVKEQNNKRNSRTIWSENSAVGTEIIRIATQVKEVYGINFWPLTKILGLLWTELSLDNTLFYGSSIGLLTAITVGFLAISVSIKHWLFIRSVLKIVQTPTDVTMV